MTPSVEPTREHRFAEAIAIANIPTLLMVIVQLTGDLRWLEPPYRPSRPPGMGDNDSGGLPATIQDEIRQAALKVVLEWDRGREVMIPEPTDELVIRMLSVAMGERVPDEYAAFTKAQLGQRSFLRAREIAVPKGFTAIVIGAGLSGICAAVNLHRAGIPFEVIERNATVGGVWWENNYPGAGVDTPNHLYSYSFAPRDWSHYFCLRDEILDYLEDVSRDFDVRRFITFDTEVTRIEYDETAHNWTVHTRDTTGATATRVANVVISAAGLFNPATKPDIPGLDDFTGQTWHTAEWPAGASIAGKDVAIIGNGASCMQTAPAIQHKVRSLTIFQRSQHWVVPFEQFRKPVPDPIRFLLRECPLYRDWYRVRLGWTWNDKVHGSLRKDPAWEHPERSMNAVNDHHRAHFTRYVTEELGDRAQELLPKVLPTYPPFGKRILLDNGWYRMLRNPNVTLSDERIDRIERHAIVTADGQSRHADVIVLATGFDVQRFLSTYETIGRSGQRLRDVWDDDNARAYLGTVVPGFPNFFVLYGPNLQFGHGGSYVSLAEIQLKYILDLIEQMCDAGLGSVEVRGELCEQYNEAIEHEHAAMVWSHPGMNTYYRNRRGRITVISPYRNVDFFTMTTSAQLDDFVTERRHTDS